MTRMLIGVNMVTEDRDKGFSTRIEETPQLNPPSLELGRQAKLTRRQTSSNPTPGTPRANKIAPSRRGATS